MIDLKSINLPELDADQLERLREDARRLLDGIEQQLEWFNAQAGSLVKPFKFSEDGPVFYAEAVEDGVLINPALPDGFSSTDNAQRSEQERARWWLRQGLSGENWRQAGLRPPRAVRGPTGVGGWLWRGRRVTR